MKLYSYWRSTTSYRVRAALNLKGVDYEIVPVNLLEGEHKSISYTDLNPGKGVPSLELDDGTILTQSTAILDFIEDQWPTPSLVIKDPVQNAKMTAVAHTIALDILPVNNLRVISQLKSEFAATVEQCQNWMIHWMREGFSAAETLITGLSDFSFGKTLTLADLYIVSQAYNAERWGLDMNEFPKLKRVTDICLEMPEILAAHPDNQPDAKV